MRTEQEKRWEPLLAVTRISPRGSIQQPRDAAMERQLRAVEVLPEAEAAALLDYDGGSDGTALDLDQNEERAAAE